MFNFLYVTTATSPTRRAGGCRSGRRARILVPTVGTGEYEWRGFLGAKAHPQTVNPAVRRDSRLELAAARLGRRGRPGRTAPCSAGPSHRRAGPRQEERGGGRGRSNKAATQDLRVMEVAGDRRRARHGSGAEPAGADRSRSPDRVACGRWGRLDRDLDGIDHPGAAIMDAAWPLIARAVMQPRAGDLVERLAQLHIVSDNANAQGSAYIDGWYGYVEKDLRAARPAVQARTRPATAAAATSTPAGSRCGRRSPRRARCSRPSTLRSRDLVGECPRRAHQLHDWAAHRHARLDEPADLPAGDELQGHRPR